MSDRGPQLLDRAPAAAFPPLTTQVEERRDSVAERVERRRMPYPYRAQLAICSDLDETPDRQLYVETLRFLNTSGATRFGPGLGLEVGNTIYFDMPPDQFSYWNTDDHGRAALRALIRSGHVDCLHSFGDLATTRAHAGRALTDLDRHGCRLDVWIDHAVAPSNFGADIMRGKGDVKGSPVYHADLSCAFGIRFVWRGRVTSVVGQDVPRRLRGIFEPAHPLASARTLAKEAAKGVLSRTGSHRYRMHHPNQVLTHATLRSGHSVFEFLRANPHWGGVSSAETAGGLGDVIVGPMLDRLTAREGMCILYTHLGKTPDPRQPFNASGLAALRRLSAEYREGRILVTTTRRLLGYAHAVRQVTWSARSDGECLHLDVRTGTASGLTPDDLEGLTFYVPDPSRTSLSVDGVEPCRIARNGPDHTGRPSVSLARRQLEFPAL
jgi:hypothetical protein